MKLPDLRRLLPLAAADDTPDRSSSWRDNPEAVEAWIQEHLLKDGRGAASISRSSKVFDGYKGHSVHSDGVVDLDCSYFHVDNVNFRQIKNYKHRIPINMGHLTGSMMAHGTWIESFDGFPTSISNVLNISGSNIKSWAGLPSSIGYLTVSIGLKNTPIDIDIASKTFVQSLNFTDIEPGICLPRVMFFKGLEHVLMRLEGGGAQGRSTALRKVIDDCLKNYPHNRTGALQLQRELIDHDFDEFSDL